VTGATGLLGATLIHDWHARWSIAGLARKGRLAIDGVTFTNADICDDEAAALIVRERPDVVVHTAAWTDLDACERDPAKARKTHVDATGALATATAKVGGRFVYISTDSMFSGPALHTESSPVDPRSVYTKTKLEGEHAALEACKDALVLRTCIVGWNAQPKLGLVEWMLRELRAKKTLPGFGDVYFTPISCADLAHVIERLVALRVTGVLNASGAEATTKYEFALRVADAFGLSRELVKRTSIEDVAFVAPRPRHPCLDSSRCSQLLGEPMPDIGQTLARMASDEREGRALSLRQSFVA
jgi:dTDP-4-dehydrorhamnose reductase